jgi:MFS transporter, ACS family, D-galactonate transporter
MTEPANLSKAMWRVLILLALSLLINYVDRGNLSIAASMIQNEFGLSPAQLGQLLSAFFWTYASCLLIAGWLVHRFDAGWVLAVGFLLWSVATAITGVVHGFVALIVLRLFLGMGESVAYPAYSKILSEHFTEERRGFANALIAIGHAGGPAVGTFAGGTLMAIFGWRPFFIALGLISLLWLVPWILWMPRSGAVQQSQNSACPSTVEILKHRSAWGTCAGLFCLNYLLYFLLTWLPYYFVNERHFSMSKMARTVGLAYLLMATVAPVAGWLSDRWIASGATPTLVRKTFMATGQGCSSIFILGCVLAPTDTAVVLLLLAGATLGISTSNNWAVTQTLAGPRAAGKWTGIQNFFGNLAGISAPALAGLAIERTHDFVWAFAMAAAAGLMGSLCWIFFVGRLEEIEWKPRQIAGAPAVVN